MSLPPLRADLEYFEGPPDREGAPTYTIFDPIRSKYFKLTWKEYQLIRLYKEGMTLDEMYLLVQHSTTLSVSKEDIQRFFTQAFHLELTSVPRKGQELYDRVAASSTSNLRKVKDTLFIKIPLFNPDAFLTSSLKYIRLLASKGAWVTYLTLTLLGIISLTTHFDDYLNTFSEFFNLKGIVIYAIAILTMKTIHEFAHAYTAKNYGVHVYSMGAALLFFLPVLYTDVTHGWRLKSRWQRVLISAAGSMAELAVGGIALLLWRISPEGTYKSVFFVLSTVALFSLFINLNPALKWDGYYILCDLWGVDNLRGRSQRYFAWFLRKGIFKLDLVSPEPTIPKSLSLGLVIYTIYSWAFRLVLLSGISYLFYHRFSKLIGTAIFLFTIITLIISPIVKEVRVLYHLRSKIRLNKTLGILLLSLTLFSAWIIFPWPHYMSFPAITAASQEQWIYSPYPGIIQQISVSRGMEVEKGDPLIRIHSEELLKELEQKEIEAELLRTKINVLIQSPKNLDEVDHLKTELQAINTEIRALQELKSDYTIKAKLSGKLIEWKKELKEGEYVPKGEVIGFLAKPNELMINAFVPERHIDEIEIGKPALFRPHGGYSPLKGKVSSISKKRVQTLEYPELASVHGGEILVVPIVELTNLTGLPEEGLYRLTQSYYIIQVAPDQVQKEYPFHISGYLRYRGPWRSYLVTGIKYLISLLRQEVTP